METEAPSRELGSVGSHLEVTLTMTPKTERPKRRYCFQVLALSQRDKDYVIDRLRFGRMGLADDSRTPLFCQERSESKDNWNEQERI